MMQNTSKSPSEFAVSGQTFRTGLRRGEDDWNGTVGKARAEIENEEQVRIFGNNRKKNKRKGYTVRSFVISVGLFAYFLCHRTKGRDKKVICSMHWV
jgi:hypothetical protein